MGARRAAAALGTAAVAAGVLLAPQSGGTFFVDGVPVTVTQGPEWLARANHFPPGWLRAAVGAATVALLAGIAWGLHRFDYDPVLLAEMGENAMIVAFVYLAMGHVKVAWDLPYAGDVLAAFAIGVAPALVLGHYLRRGALRYKGGPS